MTVKISNISRLFLSTERGLLIAGMLLIIVTMDSYCNSVSPNVMVAAERTEQYLPLLKNKSVAIVANPGSQINKTHLVDTLKELGINIRCVFAPEHGFRGEAEAGETVQGGLDVKTGIQIISLYGDHKKPDESDLFGIDVVLFDLQDVGVRFYTYISTLQYMMEACAANSLPLILLDRPNPNAHYVDGPVLEDSLRSFVGMQRVPVVYGMTIGEYAMMLNGERWLNGGVRCSLQVVKLLNWEHSTEVSLKTAPSPNLPNVEAIRLYPSLCFFEGTSVSVGRGTDLPFQCYGFPGNVNGEFTFVPRSIKGRAKSPLYEGEACRGENLNLWAKENRPTGIQLKWLINAWKSYPQKDKYFNSFFDKLAGTTALRNQIESGWSEEKIKATWEKDIAGFRQVRMKYLLYP